jgi:hypothetical protein
MHLLRAFRDLVPALAATAAVAACGGSAPTAGTAPVATGDTARPRVLEAPRVAGEIVVHGDASPASHGPFAFDGRYTVRFEQIAPEDPHLDFTGQTAFVAMVDRLPEQEGAGTVKVFSAAARTGRTRVTLHGRLYVDVSFGDFPYAIRFTPDAAR